MLGSILGGLAKVILSPLTNWIMSLIYGIFIRGPLWLLNTLDHVFQFASGSQVDKMLFDTSLVDGKPQLNFFASSSPLKYFFLLMLGVAGTLLVIFLGFAIANSITKKKSSGPARKMGQVALSASIVFAIPVMFLIVLSLTGSLLGAINGQHKDIGVNGISNYQNITLQRINRIKNSSNTASKIYKNHYRPLTNLNDEKGNTQTYSLDEIYENLSGNKKEWEIKNNNISVAAQQSQIAFKTFKKIFTSTNGRDLNPKFKNNLTNVSEIINNLTPRFKNENDADKVKALQNNLQEINMAANNFIEKSNELMSYFSDNAIIDSQWFALNNFKTYFEYMLGQKLVNAPNLQAITSLRELLFEGNSLINGDIKHPYTGLMNLRMVLSNFSQNPLVTTFYHIASGNSDDNWDRPFASMQNGGFMIFIGFILILGACIIMTMAILFAITRIFDLALLFIISPVVVVTSVFDDGERMKQWINVTLVQLISIFGIVISLRLFGTLNTQFVKAIENSNITNGSTGYLISQVAIGMFGLGGMLAAYRSSSRLSSIIGAGHGIMAGLQAGETMRILSGIANPAKSFGKMALGAAGFKSKGVRTTMNPGGKQRSRLGSVKDTWKDRGEGASQSITKASRGKIGSLKQKEAYQTNKTAKLTQKQQHYKENKSIEARQRRKSNINDSKNARKTIATDLKNDKNRNKRIK